MGILHGLVGIAERQVWLDPVSEKVQKGVAGTFEAGGTAGRKLKNFLHGTWLGHPLHPVLVDLPVGSWTVALALDAMHLGGGPESLARASDAAVTIGVAGALGAALSGLTDWEHTDGEARRVGLAHGLINLSSTALYTASLFSGNGSPATFTLRLLGYAALIWGAYLGGHLVFGLQIGTTHAPRNIDLPRYTPVAKESELKEGKPKRADAKGTAVVLVKHDDQVYALADSCSHLGCSLAEEGKIEDDSIRCNCHGSRYALKDGKVLDGPATVPQPAFQTRVRDGQVEVRYVEAAPASR